MLLLLLLILPVVYVCSNNIVGESVSFSVNIETFFVAVFYSIFYCAMNLATSSTIIEDSAQKFDKSGVKVLGFAVSATIVCLIAVISKMAAKTFSQDMPLLSLVGDGAVKIVFVVLLVFAMLSTLLSSCVGAKKMFCKTNNLVASCLLSCLIALVSFVGFAGLVKYVYPLIGAAIIVEFVFRVFIDIYNMRKKEKLSQNWFVIAALTRYICNKYCKYFLLHKNLLIKVKNICINCVFLLEYLLLICKNLQFFAVILQFGNFN